MQFTLRGIPGGEAGTDATVAAMGNMVADAVRRPYVRITALRIIERANVPDNQPWAAAAAIFNWVRSAVRFVADPIDVETVQSPEVTLRLKAGDCDDQSTLVAALAQSIGIPARFRVVGQSRDRFSHVFPELFVGGRWQPADTVATNQFGKPVRPMPAFKLYSVSGVPVMPTLGEDQRTGLRVTGLPRDAAYRAAYKGALFRLRDNWNAGRINRSDVRGYLNVLNEGNSTVYGTFLEAPIKKAVQDFIGEIQSRNAYSRKPESAPTLSGLGIIFGTLVDAAKDAVGKAWNDFKGSVSYTPPQIIVQTPPQAAQAGVQTALQSPVTWIIVAGLILVPTLLARR